MQSGKYREMKAVMNLTKPLKICFAKMSRVIMCAKMFKVENYFVIILTYAHHQCFLSHHYCFNINFTVYRC